MKKHFLTLLSMLIFSTHIWAATPPAEVLKAFKLKFPTAKNVKWDKENEHEFEASFLQNGLKYATNYTEKGEWLETESPLTFLQLPKEVQTSFSASHKKDKPKLIAKIEQAKGLIKYEIEIEKNSKAAELFYSPNGVEIIVK